MARRGIGGYQPYMQAGLDTLRRGEAYTEDYGFGGLQEALGATREGQKFCLKPLKLPLNNAHSLMPINKPLVADISTCRRHVPRSRSVWVWRIGGTGRQYDPANVSLYMNPL